MSNQSIHVRPDDSNPPRVDGTPLHAVVDTCVLLDFYSLHDFLTEAEVFALRSPLSAAVKDPTLRWRRERARDAAHLFIHFHHTRANTFSLTEELRRKLEEKAPTGAATLPTHYATVFVHYVLKDLLHGTVGHGPTNDLGVFGDRADDALVAFAREHGLPLISTEKVMKDEGIYTKASAANVACMTPATYLTGIGGVPPAVRDRLAGDFLARFDAGIESYLRGRQGADREAVQDARAYYSLILFGETAFGSMA